MILYVWLLYKSLHDLRIRESIDLSIRKPKRVKRVIKFMDLLSRKEANNIRIAIEYSKIWDCKNVRINEYIQVCNYSIQCVIIKKFISIVIYDVIKNHE